MMLEKAYRPLDRVVKSINRVFKIGGACILVVMMLLGTMDVLLRYFFDQPIKGVFELVEFMMVMVVCLGMAYTGIEKGHVAVELLASRFSPRVQAIVDSFNWLMSLGLFLLITWKTAAHARVIWKSGLASNQLHVPVFPFVFLFAFGAGLLCLVFLVNFIESVSKVVRKGARL